MHNGGVQIVIPPSPSRGATSLLVLFMTTWGPSTWGWPQVAPSMGQTKATSRPLAFTRRYTKYRQRINLGSYSTQAHYFSATPAQVKLRLLCIISIKTWPTVVFKYTRMYKSYFSIWVVTLQSAYVCRWAPRFTVWEELLRWFIQFLNFALFSFFQEDNKISLW